MKRLALPFVRGAQGRVRRRLAGAACIVTIASAPEAREW
jgi:hypothetical protein